MVSRVRRHLGLVVYLTSDTQQQSHTASDRFEGTAARQSTASTMALTDQTVVVHPLVLLSVVDHFNRIARDRVVGVLLGETSRGRIEVTNSYAGKVGLFHRC